MQSKIVILSAFLVLAVVNWSIFQKERHLSEGKIVYLELAPVDPRSLMQGDYMALNFKIAEDVRAVLLPDQDFNSETSLFNLNGAMQNADGKIVVLLDESSRASFVRLENSVQLRENELYMRYRIRNGKIKFATDAFFYCSTSPFPGPSIFKFLSHISVSRSSPSESSRNCP